MLRLTRFLEMGEKNLIPKLHQCTVFIKILKEQHQTLGLGELEPIRMCSVKGRHFDHQKLKHLQGPKGFLGSFFLKNEIYLKT